MAQRRAVLVLGDVAVLSGIVAIALRLGAARSGWPWSAAFLRAHWMWFVVLGGLWMGVAGINGLYGVRQAPDRWFSAVRSAQVSVQILLIWAVAYFVPPPWTMVRHVVVFFTLGAAVGMPAWRQAYAALFSRSAFRRRLLVVGTGAPGRDLVEAIRTEAPHEFDVLGYVAENASSAASGPATVDGVPVVATGADLAETARLLAATEIVLAVTSGVHGSLLASVLEARDGGVAVTQMAALYEEVTGRVPVEHVGDQWAVSLPLDGRESRGFYPLFKRAFDVLVASGGMVLLGVVLVPASVAIRLTSEGSVFYRQRRVGRGGRVFSLLKLRTMVADAEPQGPVWAAPDDPRATPVGRWLRRARLDELPQMMNVLRGDMSVVGPRPERPEFVAELAARIPFYRARQAVRPGLTGWATIHEGYASSQEDALLKLQRDLYYIKHLSPLLDAYILARTVGTVVGLRGR